LQRKSPPMQVGRARVVRDTCAIVTWVKKLGINTLMTNSAETAYYAPTMNSMDGVFAKPNQCLREACR
jgi:predicted aconitase